MKHGMYFAGWTRSAYLVTGKATAPRAMLIPGRALRGNLDENPYVHRKADARRQSMGRKGSKAWKKSNTRRESITRCAEIRLGVLRVIITEGITCGLDASLYIVSIMVSEESSTEVGRLCNVRKGVGRRPTAGRLKGRATPDPRRALPNGPSPISNVRMLATRAQASASVWDRIT